MAVALKPTASLYSSSVSNTRTSPRRKDSTANNDISTNTDNRSNSSSLNESPTKRHSSKSNAMQGSPEGLLSHSSDSSGTSLSSSPSRRLSLRLMNQQLQQLEQHKSEVTGLPATIQSAAQKGTIPSLYPQVLPFNEIGLNDSSSKSSNTTHYDANFKKNVVSSSSEFRFSAGNLLAQPFRVHPQLQVNPTGPKTPSSSLDVSLNHSITNTGITPSIRHINLETVTPSAALASTSASEFGRLLTAREIEEIAKDTPLGSFYGRQQQTALQKPDYKDRASLNTFDPSSVVKGTTATSGGSSVAVSTGYQLRMAAARTAGNRENALNNNSNNNSNHGRSNHVSSYSRNAAASIPSTKTPEKQVLRNDFVADSVDSGGTVKVVRTLRNRSIVASPFNFSGNHQRTGTGRASPRKSSSTMASDGIQRLSQSLRRLYLRVTIIWHTHYRNLLTYGIVIFFLSATVYHVYENFKFVLTSDSQEIATNPELTLKTTESNPTFSELSEIKTDLRSELQSFVENELENQKHLMKTSEIGLKKLVESRLQTESIFADENKLILKDSVKRNLLQAFNEITQNQVDLSVLERISHQIEDLKRQVPAINSLESTVKQLDLRLKSLETHQEHNDQTRQQQLESQSSSEHAQELFNFASMGLGAKVIHQLTSKPLEISNHWWRSGIRFHPQYSLLPSDSSNKHFFAFRGNRGRLAVSLPHPIIPTHITIEGRSPADQNTLPSSCNPRDFEIWALTNPHNELDRPVLLGQGTFLLEGPSQQTFPLSVTVLKKPIRHLQLRIRSNQGNLLVTCLRRFRVHSVEGKKQKDY